MSGLFLPQRWKRQPQGPQRIDWGNPLARELVTSILPSSSLFQDVAFNLPLTQPYGGVWQVALPTGIALTNNPLVSTPYRGGVKTSSTMLVVAQNVSFLGTALLANIDSSAVGYLLYLSSNGSITADSGSGAATSQPSLIELGKPYVAAATFFPSRGVSIFFNGKNRGTSGAFTPSGSTYNESAITASIRHRVFLGHFWSRALSDAEIAEISANPWQLFAPQRQTFFSLPGASSPFSDAVNETIPDAAQGWVATVAGATKTVESDTPITALPVDQNLEVGYGVDTFSASLRIELLDGGATVGAMFLPKRWKRQPQYPVGVNWGSPLTRGLVHALLSGPKTNAVTRTPLRPGLSIIGTVSALPQTLVSIGQGYLFNGWIFVTGEQATVYTPTVQVITAGPTPVSSRPQEIATSVGVFDPAAGVVRFWQEGRLAATSPAWDGTVATASQIQLDIPQGRLGAGLVYARALSGEEISALSENPYQILAPQRATFYSLPGDRVIKSVDVALGANTLGTMVVTPAEQAGISLPWTPRWRVTSL